MRESLLTAAAESFATKGFAGSRTAEIAARAGASESTLFAHFPSKGDLFVAATLEAFVRFTAEMADLSARTEVSGDEEGTVVEYVGALYDHVAANRDAVAALLTDSRDPDALEFTESARRRFQQVLAELTRVAGDWSAALGRTVPRIDLRVRLPIAMIVSTVVFDRWFLPEEGRYGRDTLVRELAGQVLRGAVTHRHPPELP